MNISKTNLAFIVTIAVLTTYIITREVSLKDYPPAVNGMVTNSTETTLAPKAKNPTGKDGQEVDPYEKEQVKNTIVKNSKTIQECYLDWLKSNPKKEFISVKIDWTISSSGSVDNPQIVDSTAEEDMNTCLLNKMKSLSFPIPPEGRPFYVAHKFAFKTEALLEKEKKEREVMEKKFLPKNK